MIPLYNYGTLQATAERLIERFGKPATLYRVPLSGPPHAPVQGTPVEYPCKLVETENTITNRDATLVKTGDKFGLISTDMDSEPMLADSILIGGNRYNFVKVKPLSPGPTTMYHEFLARM